MTTTFNPEANTDNTYNTGDETQQCKYTDKRYMQINLSTWEVWWRKWQDPKCDKQKKGKSLKIVLLSKEFVIE